MNAFDDDAMKEPIVVETEEGLGMKMPPSGFTVDDVAEALGEDYPVEVIGTYCYSLALNKWSLSHEQVRLTAQPEGATRTSPPEDGRMQEARVSNMLYGG